MPTVRWPRAIMHLDMDAFFVNVHLLTHPDDRGVPLAVGGRPEHRGVVASASYEARALGIHSAMPMKTAARLCRSLKIVSANWDQIRTQSRAIMQFLHDVGPTEQVSVDEAYVDLSAHADPAGLAIALRARVKHETQLPASVGLATSKLVAKVASDFDKPEGCTIVGPGEEAAFLAPLRTRAIWGIGAVTAERLALMGVNTCGELAAMPLAQLEAAFGNQAESLKRRAQGQDRRPVVTEHGMPRSISQEWTFSQDLSDPEQLAEKLRSMCDKVSHALKRRELLARTVNIKLRWSDFTTLTRQKSLVTAIDDAEAIFKVAHTIWRENWPDGRPIRLLGVGVSNIEPLAHLRQLQFDF